MSQENQTVKRFKERVDARLGKDFIVSERPKTPKLGRDEYTPIPITEEITPVKLDLSLDPKETKQAISQIENSNILNNLLKNPLEYSPKTKLIVAISSLVSLIVTYLSGCF